MKVSYSKEQREKAKREGKGLATIEIVGASGSRMTLQMITDDRIARRAYNHFLKLASGKA